MIRQRMERILERLEFPSLDPCLVSELPEHSFKGQLDQEVIDKINQSMRARGWWGPPVVTVGPNHQVVDGRHRIEAAKKAGIPVRVLNISEDEFEAEISEFPVRSLDAIARLFIEAKKKRKKRKKRRYYWPVIGGFSFRGPGTAAGTNGGANGGNGGTGGNGGGMGMGGGD